MKKTFKLFLVFTIALLAIPFQDIAIISAEEVNYKDGNYKVPIEVKHATEDKESFANNYVTSPAKLNVENGQLNFEITASSELQSLKVLGVDATLLSDDDNEKVFAFSLPTDFSNPVEMDMHVIVDIPGFKYDQNHTVRTIFDMNGVSVVEENPEDETEVDNGSDEGTEEDNGSDEGNGGDDESGADKEPEQPVYEPAKDERVIGNLVTEDEADDVYELEFDSDSPATKGQLENPVKLLVKGNEQYVQIPVNARGAGFFKSFKFNGEEVTWNNTSEAPYVIQYKLQNGIQDTIDVSMVIDTGDRVMPHDDIELWFTLTDKRVTGELVKEEDSESVEVYEYGTDSPATAGQLLNPVKVLEKDDKQYLQIPINSRGAQYFKSLRFNGEEVVWNSIAEAPYVIQYELPNGVESTIDVSMIIDTGRMVMPHADIELWLENRINNVNFGEKAEVKPNDKVIIDNSKDYVKAPEDLPENVNVTIENQTADIKKFNINGDLEIAGEVYEFNFEGLDDSYSGEFELSFAYDEEAFPSSEYEVDIYYYNVDKQEWEAQGGNVENGQVIATVKNFSTYGVFAIPLEEEEETNPQEKTPEPQEVANIKEVDSAYTIDYTILNKTENETSAADIFFNKPALLLEKDGVNYVQITTNANQFIDALSNHYGNFIKVGGDEDGEFTYQFRVAGELTDEQFVDMVITVPGVYEDQEHETRLVLDVDSMVAVNAADYELAEGTKTNANGPTVGEQEVPAPTPSPTPTPTPTTGDGNGQGGEGTQETPNPKKVDRAYTIDFTIYDEAGSKVSIADEFFNKPALLLEKDGVYYVQITTNSNKFINSLSNRFGEFIKVGGSENGEFTYQFRVDGNLTDDQIITMVITVPEIPGYDHKEFNTRLVFDVDSMEEVNADDYELALGTSENANGPTSEGATPDKPDLGNGKGENGSDPKESGLNPQTGDTTAILMYSLLLVAAATALFFQLRRRFAKE